MSSTTTTTMTKEAMVTPAKQDLETPFTTAVLGSDVEFWRSYIAGRPAPSDGFFDQINDYHKANGDYRFNVCHDVGTGPGNIAQKLAQYYTHVVGSDVNDQALAAASAIIPPETLKRMTFIKAPAEEVANGAVPLHIGKGNTDLVVVSECMPLLDPVKSLQGFNRLLRKGGTLAIYFYGRPLFADGTKTEREALDSLYDQVASKICSFLLPFKDTPGFPAHQRGAEALVSWMDNIEIPTDSWRAVERYKWNSDVSLLFNSKSAYDFEFERVDRRSEGEKTVEMIDRSYWQVEWNIEQVAGYLASVYPNYHKKAGDRMIEVLDLLAKLESAMSGPRSVSFPVSLILATKK